MQLIMDTEPSADIKEKMSIIDESLDTNHIGPIENLKNEIVNGNKENIESQQNIMECTVDTANEEGLKHTNGSATDEFVNKEDYQTGDVEIKTEDVVTDINEGDVCETGNGNGLIATSEADKIHEDDSPLNENTDSVTNEVTNNVQENINEDGNLDDVVNKDNLKDDIIIEDYLNHDEDEAENNKKTDAVEILNNFKDAIVKEKIEDTSLSNMEDGNAVFDCIVADNEKNNLEEEVVGSAASIETDTIKESASRQRPIDAETGEIKQDNKISKCLDIMDTDLQEITEEDTVTQHHDTIHTKMKYETDPVNSDPKPMDKSLEETSENNTVETALELSDTETNIEEIVTVDTNTVNEDEEITQITEEGNILQNLNDESQNVEDISDIVNCDTFVESNRAIIKDKEEILDIDEFIKDIGDEDNEHTEEQEVQEPDQPATPVESKKPPICKLSNTLDILSDDDEESSQPVNSPPSNNIPESTDKQCINIIEDDDDIMLIDEDTDSKESKSEPSQPMEMQNKEEETVEECKIDLENNVGSPESKKIEDSLPDVQKDSTVTEIQPEPTTKPETIEEKTESEKKAVHDIKKPLVAENFLKNYKKNLVDMTRDELEEFCILKIVEGIVDRSNLSEIKTKLKLMAQSIDEYKKKAMMLTKQNRDLQLVLKSVQEEQKKKSDTAILPLKITRSVGMQVFMNEKPPVRKKNVSNSSMNVNSMNSNKPPSIRPVNQSPRPQKIAANNPQIPVPRLVPAATNPAVKAPNTLVQANTSNNSPKTLVQSAVNGMKVTSPVQKTAEKRTHNRTQSVTVDLTDDEPPAKVTPRSSPAPPVRLVSPQNLLTRPQFTQALNSPRKVYIPISGPQGQNIRPGQAIMIKSAGPGPRLRGPSPTAARMSSHQLKLSRVSNNRHPAPLPEGMKQYQPPNWKALPPAPDLKLAKADNGIVISWKIEGYQEDSYEEIASYQIYAYQETSSPPNTSLWKKIGDVKALPLPMACTLTQFMAGYKYYFAVRAVDVRSRLGPFSLPGSILLLNKV